MKTAGQADHGDAEDDQLAQILVEIQEEGQPEETGEEEESEDERTGINLMASDAEDDEEEI